MSEPIPTIVLAGNPNVGKSTIFNCLTGMHQHTGNWSGKTVSNAEGIWRSQHGEVKLVDAPGCYSLNPSSLEEEVAREQILDENCWGIIIVCDGTCLERNLILALQIISHRKDVVLCINLMDQVRKKGLEIDIAKLQELVGVKVIATESTKKNELKRELNRAASELIEKTGGELKQVAKVDCHSPEEIIEKAELIARKVVRQVKPDKDRTLISDRIVTSRIWSFPIMALVLMIVLWITMKGANYPSEVLSNILFSLENPLYEGLMGFGLPTEFCEMISFGMYRVLAWVVSVMLPPMAIFFPLFTLLEDWGFLPRIAFNMDRCFKCCRACGKQALIMCMGLGCNASAVVGCRIIDSKRERLLAMITNSLMPCNGRFPILIALIAMFFASSGSLVSAAWLTGIILLGIIATMVGTKVLSKTLLKGMPSSFVLELPAYRKPEITKVIVRSIFDRTLFVLARAASVAAPCGALIWILSNVYLGDETIISYLTDLFNPLGQLIGLDGVILTAFVLGLPANEIVLPLIMMMYMGQGSLSDVGNLMAFKELLLANGWTALTAVNILIFTLMHWPCATTLLSIKKEAGSMKWVVVSVLTPLILGVAICFITSLLYRFFL
ncbi:MAG: ferrous iron transporter B [Firmicutes bacterium]|nr:ferrous iron transporter B [Bacillota bacterium]